MQPCTRRIPLLACSAQSLQALEHPQGGVGFNSICPLTHCDEKLVLRVLAVSQALLGTWRPTSGMARGCIAQ